MSNRTMEDKILQFKKDLLLKSLELNSNAICNIDNQSLNMKNWCILIWSIIIGWGVKTNLVSLLYIGVIIAILFWFVNTFIKQDQRGYIETSNFVRARLSDEQKIREIVTKNEFGEIPIFDMNGNYTIKENNKYQKGYKKKTSFFFTFTLKELRSFYGIMIVINLLIIFLSK